MRGERVCTYLCACNLSVNVYVCAYTCEAYHVCVCVCAVHLCARACRHVHVCANVRVYVRMCVYVWMLVCVHACLFS